MTGGAMVRRPIDLLPDRPGAGRSGAGRFRPIDVAAGRVGAMLALLALLLVMVAMAAPEARASDDTASAASSSASSAAATPAATIPAATPATPSIASALALLADGDPDSRSSAIAILAAVGGEPAIRILQAMRDGALQVTPDGRAIAERDGGRIDVLTGGPLAAPVTDALTVTVNNRLRNAIGVALAGLGLTTSNPALRLAAVRGLQDRPDPARLDAMREAERKETDSTIRSELAIAIAMLELKNSDGAVRAAAARTLGASDRRDVRGLLEALVARNADGSPADPDPAVRVAAGESLNAVDRRLIRNDWLGRLFAGLSLGSILMLAALGLAITYGLLGVINMAHGEMIMIGAYATWLTQGLVRQYLPGWFDLYPLLALPVAFVVCGLVGIVIERLVIRHLYGRPLETLLATWGVSLILIQLVRHLFGPQNVEIVNPSWMSGGIEWSTLVLPWNRIVILAFSALVLIATALILARTRLGLFVRGVTQNRPMAGAIGVPTARVDMLAFGLGSAIAGLAGVALSQVGNVGPELGQAWIIDSFIVVVAGGVGQLAGAVVAGLGLGVLSKFIEPSMGAVVTKIVILVLIIGFIQRRPQGLFALRERSADN